MEPLFEGKLIRLSAPDPDKDAEIEARWLQDPIYQAMIQRETVRPLSAGQVWRKSSSGEDGENEFRFAIRAVEDQRLLGFVEIKHIEWTHGLGWVFIRIGERGERHKGYGSEALRLVLRYAFEELNLNHLIAQFPAYNFPAQKFFEKAGFVEEVRRREAVLRFERRWDSLLVGLLREEFHG